MATRFVVTQIKFCHQCGGTGILQHPAWKAYWKEHSGKPAGSREEDRKWFEEHGWSDGLSIRTDGHPDEEIICSECDGKGEIVSEIDLHAALKAYEEMSKCAARKSTEPCTCEWH